MSLALLGVACSGLMGLSITEAETLLHVRSVL